MENQNDRKLDYSVHSDDMFLENCRQCKKIFLNKQDFQQHIDRTHIQSNLIQISECGKAYSSSTSLEKRKWSHTHGGKHNHQCSLCDKSFSKKFNLNLHMMVHTKDKPYQCSQCDKAFSQSCNLVNHMTIHTGEKPHKCTECGRNFSLKKSLTDHFMIHTGEKPHECSQCEKSFSKKSHLKRHMMIHTGEKPYQCIHCKLAFSQKAHLLRHAELAHNWHDLQVNFSKGKQIEFSIHKTNNKFRPKKYSRHTKKSNKQIKSELESDEEVDKEIHFEVTKNNTFSSEEILIKIEKDIEDRKSKNMIIYQEFT